MSQEIEAKLILVGETNVGKTSLLRQYIDHLFQEEKVSTIGYDTMLKKLELPNGNISLQLWDTCGQEQFRTVNQLFVKNSKMALLVYDITNKKSFEELKNFWYSYVTSAVGKNIIFGIAANKSDLYEYEQVNEKEARDYANSINASFRLCSALNNEGINELVDELTDQYLTLNKINYKTDNNDFKIEDEEKIKKKKCC